MSIYCKLTVEHSWFFTNASNKHFTDKHIHTTMFYWIAESRAIKLLPLAKEYQLTNLQKACEERLLRYETPRLEFVTIAEKYNLPDLLKKATDDCVQKLSTNSIEYQFKEPGNQCIGYETLCKIYRQVLFQSAASHSSKIV